MARQSPEELLQAAAADLREAARLTMRAQAALINQPGNEDAIGCIMHAKPWLKGARKQVHEMRRRLDEQVQSKELPEPEPRGDGGGPQDEGPV